MGRKVTPKVVRFWKYVSKGKDCWFWTGYTDKDGYGKFQTGSTGTQKPITAHRYSWKLHYGPIRKGLFVLHHCDNPACCNPKHLFVGTLQDNVDDKVAKRRQSHGENHGMAKVTTNDVMAIRSLYKQGLSQRAIAPLFNISQVQVSHITSRVHWSHV